MSSQLHLADANRFKIRPAHEDDLQTLTNDVWFHSFGVDPFWAYIFPDSPTCRREYLDKMWDIGLKNPSDRTFVVVDTQKNDRVIALSRWQVPQADGNRDRKWPEIPEGLFDMELCDAFFGGMTAHRAEIMEKRPHWFLEVLGVHEDYQGTGVGALLLKWGTDQADKDGLETYLDASSVGQPYYEKRHGFKPTKKMFIPDRPAYGSYNCVSMVRPPQTRAA